MRQSDFANSDDYATYVRDHIAIGMHVRCCRSYDDLGEGDIGSVVQLDKDGLHDLNLQVILRLGKTKKDQFSILYITTGGVAAKRRNLLGSIRSRGDNRIC